MEEYHYQALARPSEIRVLSLLDQDPDQDLVKCRLQHVCIPLEEILGFFELPQHGPYEAVSWTWGDPTDSEKVYVEDGDTWKTVNVRPNLIIMLKHFQRHASPSLLWVDAVCINQQDEAERSSQVTMMAEIYHYASNVRVWLGPHDPVTDSKLAFQFMRRDLTDLFAPYDPLTHDKHLPALKALLALMRRRWFSRRWIVQETVHARSVSLYCGNDSIGWDAFVTAVNLFLFVMEQIQEQQEPGLDTNVRALDTPMFGYITTIGAAQLIELCSDLFRSNKYSPEGYIQDYDPNERRYAQSLTQVISQMAAFEAARPHDLIYAVLSLASETRDCLGTGPKVDRENDSSPAPRKPVFEINYEADFHHACRQLFSVHLKNNRDSHSLDILCRPWAPRQKQNLPSWIPSVTLLPFETSYKLYQPDDEGVRKERQNHDPLVGVEFDHFNACGSAILEREDWELGDEDDTYQKRSLFVTGFELDRIGHVAVCSPNGDVPAEWYALADVELQPAGALLESQQRSREAFITTLVANGGAQVLRGRFTMRMANRVNILAATSASGIEINRLTRSPDTAEKEYRWMLEGIQAVALNRRMARSTRLQQLCMMPTGAKQGDRICILKGCSVPVVLRELEDDRKTVYHVLVGECYVHTMMDGAAVAEQKEHQLPFERLELR